MEMEKYLVDTFLFNDKANRKVLETIKILPDNAECMKLFSHLINCMYKWIAGIKNDPVASKLEWWNPVYPLNRLEDEWENCMKLWLEYINGISDEELNTEVVLNNFDGGNWAIRPADIALQLNYHSIHHRGQMQYIIRNKGLKPKYIEYIGDKYRKIE
jgi:uncharacterized damage-inducible protein DinB